MRASLLYTIRGNPLRLLSTVLIEIVVLIVSEAESVSCSCYTACLAFEGSRLPAGGVPSYALHLRWTLDFSYLSCTGRLWELELKFV